MNLEMRMRSLDLHNTRHRPLLASIGLALLLQCLFPSGYMPGALQDGWIAALCPKGMPPAFMAQFNQASAQSAMDHHAHHAHHVQGEQPQRDSDHHAGHASSSECQLGAGFDQGFDLAFAISQIAPGLVQSSHHAVTGNPFTSRLYRNAHSRDPPRLNLS